MTVEQSEASRLGPLFDSCREDNRAALIGYLPTGYPDVSTSVDGMIALVESGCDIVEVGVRAEQFLKVIEQLLIPRVYDPAPWGCGASFGLALVAPDHDVIVTEVGHVDRKLFGEAIVRRPLLKSPAAEANG